MSVSNQKSVVHTSTPTKASSKKLNKLSLPENFTSEDVKRGPSRKTSQVVLPGKLEDQFGKSPGEYFPQNAPSPRKEVKKGKDLLSEILNNKLKKEKEDTIKVIRELP